LVISHSRPEVVLTGRQLHSQGRVEAQHGKVKTQGERCIGTSERRRHVMDM